MATIGRMLTRGDGINRDSISGGPVRNVTVPAGKRVKSGQVIAARFHACLSG
jgi:hypothetical protein